MRKLLFYRLNRSPTRNQLIFSIKKSNYLSHHFLKYIFKIFFRLEAHPGVKNLETRLKRGPSTSAAADAAATLNNPPSYPPPSPPQNDFVEIELVFLI
jgi:hypothetical protein